MEVTTYNCTTTLFNHKTGKYPVSGSSVTLKPAKDHWKNTSCCAAGNSEKDKTPEIEEMQGTVRENDQGKPVPVLDKG